MKLIAPSRPGTHGVDMSDAPARIEALAPKDWHPSLSAIAENWNGANPGANIIATAAQHPKLLTRWLAFGAHMADTALPARLREIAILRVAWNAQADYEWSQHVGLGLRAGLTDAEIQRVTHGPEHEGWSTVESIVLRAVDDLTTHRAISDELWQSAAEQLPAQELLDLLFVVGHYTMIAMVVKTLRVPLEDGAPRMPLAP